MHKGLIWALVWIADSLFGAASGHPRREGSWEHVGETQFSEEDQDCLHNWANFEHSRTDLEARRGWNEHRPSEHVSW